jgi:membrane-associated phospholipid phosphatase
VKPAVGILIGALALFGALTVAVIAVGTLPGEAAARDAALALVGPQVVAALRVINYAGSWRLLLPATVLLLLAFPRARRRWWVWVGMMLAAPATEGLLKVVVGRARPEDPSMGFPSGHANAAAAFFGAVIYLAGSLPTVPRRLVRVVAIVTIALVALARIVLRAHWPADALAGIALGLAFASAAAELGLSDSYRSSARTTGSG